LEDQYEALKKLPGFSIDDNQEEKVATGASDIGGQKSMALSVPAQEGLYEINRD